MAFRLAKKFGYDFGSSFKQISKKGSYLYFTGGSSALIIDVSSPLNPVKEPTSPSIDTLGKIAISADNNTLYLLTSEVGSEFQVFDVSDKTSINVLGTMTTGGSQFGGISTRFLNDTKVVIAFSDVSNNVTIQVVDVTNPASPATAGTPLTFTYPGEYVTDIDILGTILFVSIATGSDTYVKIYSLADIDAPVLLSTTQTVTNSTYSVVMKAYGTNTYVISKCDGGTVYRLTINDISDPLNPVQVANFVTSLNAGYDVSNIDVFGSTLVVNNSAEGSGEVAQFNVSDPSNPIHLQTSAIDDDPKGLVIDGYNFYVTAYPYLYIYSYSSHTNNSSLQNVFLVFADTDGDVQTYNTGTSDNGLPIYFELETQELEFGNRAHLKKISDQIVAFTNGGVDTELYAATDGEDFKPIQMSLSERVNIGENINLEGHYVVFRWLGQTTDSLPVFEGLYIENITDMGLTNG